MTRVKVSPSGIISKQTNARAFAFFVPNRARSTAAVNAEHNVPIPKPFSQVPGPTTYPFIKAALEKYRNPEAHRGLTTLLPYLYEKYGDMVRYELPSRPPQLFLYNPELLQIIMREGIAEWPTQPLLAFWAKYRSVDRKEWFEDSLGFISNGEQWYKIRSKVQVPMLRPQLTKYYMASMDSVAKEFVHHIVKRRDQHFEVPSNFEEDLHRWALESIGLVALNARLGAFEADPAKSTDAQTILDGIDDVFTASGELEVAVPFWKIFNTKDFKRLARGMDAMYEVTLKQVTIAADKLKEKDLTDVDVKTLSVLDQMLLNPDMSIKMAYTGAIDMILTGVDTTASGMAFLLYSIAKHPEAQEKLRDEVRRVLPNKDDAVTVEAINSMQYMKAAVKESMRFLPVAPGLAKLTSKDVVLDGYHIPKGTFLFPGMMVMYQMEKHYPEPHKFKPERWLRGHPEQFNSHPYAYLPFGFGPRSCIGKRITLQEIWTLLVNIIQNFKVEYHHEDMRMKNRLNNVPDTPLRFTFKDL